MNIDGMGDALVDQLVDRGLVKNVADIYRLNKPTCSSLERMGDKSAQNVLDEIAGSKKLPLERVIYRAGNPLRRRAHGGIPGAALRLAWMS